ncbi:MAG: hypothetical protein ACI8QS_000113 [Planctomycetota bacterium]
MLLEVPSIEDVLRYEWDELLRIDHLESMRACGLGQALALVIGLEGLNELVARSEAESLDSIPLPWILLSADLEPLSQENLSAAFRQALGIENSDTRQTLPTIRISDSKPPMGACLIRVPY